MVQTSQSQKLDALRTQTVLITTALKTQVLELPVLKANTTIMMLLLS